MQWNPKEVGQGAETWHSNTRGSQHDQVCYNWCENIMLHVMSRKVQLVTSKLDQAHGKAREIEAIVIASIAFDNRFCHALTLNRLISFSFPI